MQVLPLSQDRGQLAFQLNFKFSGEVLHLLVLHHVVFGCLWTLTDISNKQAIGARGGCTFFLHTFKAHGRNS